MRQHLARQPEHNCWMRRTFYSRACSSNTVQFLPVEEKLVRDLVYTSSEQIKNVCQFSAQTDVHIPSRPLLSGTAAGGIQCGKWKGASPAEQVKDVAKPYRLCNWWRRSIDVRSQRNELTRVSSALSFTGGDHIGARVLLGGRGGEGQHPMCCCQQTECWTKPVLSLYLPFSMVLIVYYWEGSTISLVF